MAASLRLNEPITFGKTGSVREMDPHGFDLSEVGYSWTQEEVAGFSAVMGSVPPDANLRLHLNARPFTQAGHIDKQQFFLFVNGLFIGFRSLTVGEAVEFALPRNALSPRGLRFEFAIPTASSPKSMGISQDIRKLGIAIAEISISIQK
jgi:hypothetical protein